MPERAAGAGTAREPGAGCALQATKQEASKEATAPAAVQPVEAAAPARSRDEAWIDTPRCPSCNECQLINDRMFAYDERKQAFIKDHAGTYRQLAKPPSRCQVAIIHPGKPRNPNEPGLARRFRAPAGAWICRSQGAQRQARNCAGTG
jgi:hypothetical protein